MSTYALRIPEPLFREMHEDLDRPHAFAFERVAFLHCAIACAPGQSVLLAAEYRPVADEDYLPTEEYGALVGPTGIRRAFERAYARKGTVIHVHRHEHSGRPAFSVHDEATNHDLVPSFWNVAPDVPHGAIVLSHDQAHGLVWDPTTRRAVRAAAIRVVGCRLMELA